MKMFKELFETKRVGRVYKKFEKNPMPVIPELRR
jgi:hypothetical protein